jgi:hypothetical protein
MTKGKALDAWFSQLMTFYPSTAVPDDAAFPYGTYEAIFDSYTGGEVGLTVNLWFNTESEAVPNAKAQELSERIGLSGAVIPCDGGYIWLKRGSPWCQSLTDDTHPNIKRRYINVTVEYLTIN